MVVSAASQGQPPNMAQAVKHVPLEPPVAELATDTCCVLATSFARRVALIGARPMAEIVLPSA